MPDYQCPKCGRPVAPDASFCSNCGSPLAFAVAAAPPPPSPTDETIVGWAPSGGTTPPPTPTAPVAPGPTVAGWQGPAAAATQSPKAWWKRPKGIAAIAGGLIVALLVIGSFGNAGRDQTAGANTSPGPSLAAAAVSTPSPTIARQTVKPTAAPEDTPEPEPTAEPPEEATDPPPPPVKAKTYATPSSRQWAQIVKSPDKYIGKGYHIFACITQFDAATGPDSFRGDASYKKQEYWSLYGDNSFFSGTEDQLADYVTNDIVVMNVTSLGSYSYDTQIGGNTTVPLFQVDSIGHKGSCA